MPSASAGSEAGNAANQAGAECKRPGGAACKSGCWNQDLQGWLSDFRVQERTRREQQLGPQRAQGHVGFLGQKEEAAGRWCYHLPRAASPQPCRRPWLESVWTISTTCYTLQAWKRPYTTLYSGSLAGAGTEHVLQIQHLPGKAQQCFVRSCSSQTGNARLSWACIKS